MYGLGSVYNRRKMTVKQIEYVSVGSKLMGSQVAFVPGTTSTTCLHDMPQLRGKRQPHDQVTNM